MKKEPKNETRVLPNDENVEISVLGGCIFNSNLLGGILEHLTEETFLNRFNSVLFKCLVEMYNEGLKIDLTSLTMRLKQNGWLELAGGVYHLMRVNDNVSTADLDRKVLYLKELYFRRKVIMEAMDIVNQSYDVTIDVEDITGKVNTLIDNTLNHIFKKSETISIDEAQINYAQMLQDEEEKFAQGISPLQPYLDKVRTLVPKYEGGNLIIIAARPAMGKTAFMLHEFLKLSEMGHPTLFFSLEMTDRELYERTLLVDELVERRDLLKLGKDSKDWERLDRAFGVSRKYNKMYLNCTPSLTVAKIKAITKVHIQRYGIRAVCIDYLQLMTMNSRLPREQQVSETTRLLKQMAMELDIPIFLLSQLNRAVETRENHEPTLADLRESGAIEQDANIVGFIVRHEVYKDNDPEYDPILDNTMTLYIKKNRAGQTGVVTFYRNKSVTKFSCTPQT